MIYKALGCLLILILSLPALAGEPAKTVPLNQAQLQLSFSPLVKKTAPAVVNIYTRRTIQTQISSPFLNDPIYNQLLEFNNLHRERIENSLGSGVIVRANGLIVTNNHVIKGSDEIKVVLADKREFQAKVLLEDKKTDLALLTIDTHGEELPYLLLSDSDALEAGDLVLALGNPFGFGQTVTSGIVSDPARTTVGVGDYQFFIQTDAAINPGNSGGALVNMQGKLVGVNTAIFSSTGTSSGIGFAIPSNMVKTIINSGTTKTKNSHIVRPWLGAMTQNITSDLATTLALKIPRGVLVNDTYPGGPAAEGGLKQGDVIIGMDEHEITDEASLRFRVATYAMGKKAQLKVVRAGHEMIIPVVMRPPLEVPARDARSLKGNSPLAGADVVNLSPAIADELDFIIIKGVVVWNVSSPSLAEKIGLMRGDILEAVNRVPVTSTKQLEELLAQKTSLWEILIQRNNNEIRLLVKK